MHFVFRVFNSALLMILSFPFCVVSPMAPSRKAKVVAYLLADNAISGQSLAFSNELYVLGIFQSTIHGLVNGQNRSP